MSRVGKTILWSVVGIVMLGFLYVGFHVWLSMLNGDKVVLRWQLNRVINKQTAIESVATDKYTTEFLEQLPKNPRITSIREGMDHNNDLEHYSAYINGRYVDMYVHGIGWLPFYSVSEISVSPLPYLGEFYME